MLPMNEERLSSLADEHEKYIKDLMEKDGYDDNASFIAWNCRCSYIAGMMRFKQEVEKSIGGPPKSP